MTANPEAESYFIIKVSCPSGPGQVAAISRFLDERDCYIMEFAQFEDELSGRFFVRALFRTRPDRKVPLAQLRQEFPGVADRFQMTWAIHDTQVRPRVLIMVSKFDHCLDDLLYRRRAGELKMDVTAVVSNHRNLESLARGYQVPFFHLPVTSGSKPQQEARLLEIIKETQTDLVVLARYMQILSDTLCEALNGRAINIHHSFLPGFKGARPYHQAHERGVKLIGATAHYVTADLDEGPIIEQVVERVDHTCRPEHLVTVGRDSEKMALARAVKFHTEHRVFLNGTKTVVFR